MKAANSARVEAVVERVRHGYAPKVPGLVRQFLRAKFTVAHPVVNEPVAVRAVGVAERVKVKTDGFGADGKKSVLFQKICDALALGLEHVARKPHSRNQQRPHAQRGHLVLNRRCINFRNHRPQTGRLAPLQIEFEGGSARTLNHLVAHLGKKVALLAQLALELHDGFGHFGRVEQCRSLPNVLQPTTPSGSGLARPALVQRHVGVAAQHIGIGLYLNEFEVLVVAANLRSLSEFDAANPSLPLGQPSLGVARCG